MYLKHFGLAEPPFRLTPDTGRYFEGGDRGRVLEALIYAILRGEGIIRVSGEVGSGKTLLARMLAQRLPAGVETACLTHPALSREELLFALAEELDVSVASERPAALLHALRQRLIELHAAGRRVVVLIDEAHAMPPATLEEIRLLSNVETREAKLLQIVLFGQPELDELLAQPGMRPLTDRITQHFTLAPLSREDVAAYVAFRLRAAGRSKAPPFSKAALRLLARASGGLTRRINVLADKALLAAFAAGAGEVGAAHIRLALRDARLSGARAKRGKWLLAGACAAALLAGGAMYFARHGGPAPARDHTAPAPAGGPDERAPSIPDASPAPPAAAAARPEAAPAAIARGDPAEAHPAPDPKPDPAPETAGPRTRALLERTRKRLASTPPDHWFIQILSAPASGTAEVERFIAAAARLAEEERLGAYLARSGAAERIAVIYGEYPDLAAASAALATLPAELRAHGAFPRAFGRLGG
ncbi:MAG: hypothetical protein Fur0039_10320 [Rhodocyclaceae bacterium]